MHLRHPLMGSLHSGPQNGRLSAVGPVAGKNGSPAFLDPSYAPETVDWIDT